MKMPDIRVFISVIMAPTAAFIAINGSAHQDGSQVTLGIAIITMLGILWGPPGGKGGGGNHAR